ncbi:calcium-regulated heat-stable protein 1-like [Orbicella faveolata]|uniref:calcium-regulated heat-stable protein 1-like n=1 Tax=Orbicella faveolata TaxID=48498 RepID=UPI0009E28ACE|nr:calcium-regulated heat-stable protein 1-like [Orbicella faveolata]
MSSDHKDADHVHVADEKPAVVTKDHSSSKRTSTPESSPPHARKFPFKIPSPIPTRRTRTTSQSRIASESPEQTGVCKNFCRNKGHGFITPDDGGKDIFVHISDIEGEFVPKEGDRVTFRTCPLPPKNVEKQAVMVVLTELKGAHEKWWSNS